MGGMAERSRLYKLWGCVLTFVFFAAIFYGGIIGAGFVWWGPGFMNAIRARRAPESMRDAKRVAIYDSVIESDDRGVTFRRSTWSLVRSSIGGGLLCALAVVVARRSRKLWLPIAIAIAMIWFVVSSRSSPVIHIARNTPGQVMVLSFQIGGGQSGTKHTTAFVTGYDIVLRTRHGDMRLVRLPYNELRDAEVWRAIVEAKLRRG